MRFRPGILDAIVEARRTVRAAVPDTIEHDVLSAAAANAWHQVAASRTRDDAATLGAMVRATWAAHCCALGAAALGRIDAGVLATFADAWDELETIGALLEVHA